jgi:hypothetical protein
VKWDSLPETEQVANQTCMRWVGELTERVPADTSAEGGVPVRRRYAVCNGIQIPKAVLRRSALYHDLYRGAPGQGLPMRLENEIFAMGKDNKPFRTRIVATHLEETNPQDARFLPPNELPRPQLPAAADGAPAQ